MTKKLFDQTESRYRAPPKVIVVDENVPPVGVSKHKSFGRVPSYIVRREADKAEQQRADAEKVRLAAIPAGFRYMLEDERQSTLVDLELRRRNVMDELKRLPLAMSTLAQRKEKIRVELVLMDLDKTIEKLSVKNVLIQL